MEYGNLLFEISLEDCQKLEEHFKKENMKVVSLIEPIEG